MIRIPGIFLALAATAGIAAAGDVKVALKHQATSNGPSVSITAATHDWMDAPSEKIGKMPALKSKKARWAEIELAAGTDRTFTVLLDDAGEGEALLYVDANNDEDLTNDGEPAKEYSKESKSLGKYSTLLVEHGKTRSEYQMYVYWYRANEKGVTAYRGMDWWEGTAKLAGAELRFGIVDTNNDGCFNDLEHTAIVFDYNQDGRLEGERDSNEQYMADEPFPAAGKGWTVKSVSEAGDEIVFVESADAVAMKPSLSPGAPAPDFTGQDEDGNDIALSSLLGKVVLVQFWSYQSGDAALALDKHRPMYKAYKDKGYTILGVNIDKDVEKAQEFAKKQDMDWPVVYDGDMLGGPIAKAFRLWHYPRAYLVDADGMIRDNNVYITNLEKALQEMLSDTDAEPLVAAKPADLEKFLPRVEKGDWWLVFHQRRGELDNADFLLFMVMQATPERLGIVVTSTYGWSFMLAVDRQTWSVVRATPTYVDWDQKKEKIQIAPEKERSIEINGAPSLTLLRQYPLLDVIFQLFPASDSGQLTAITEKTGEKSEVETAPLSCESFLDANGRLVARYKASLGGRSLRIKQTWEAGLPFPRRVTYSSAISGSRGLLILCRSGKELGRAFPAKPAVSVLVGVDSQNMDPSAFRCPQRNLVGEDALAAVCAKLAPGVPTQSLDFRGDAYWQRGDIVKLYWQVRSIPKTLSGPKKDPENQVSIPTSGLFVLECVDIRRVGEEDLIFIMAHGNDSQVYSYDTTATTMAGQQAETIADMLSGGGAMSFSNPEYWIDKEDPKKARWDRVASIRAKRYGGHSFNTYAANARQATTWMIALRREDLSLRAAVGFHLDPNLKVSDISVVADQFKQGPTFVRQSLQLVRPQDWMLIQAFAGLKVNGAKGNVLSISPTDGNSFRTEMLKDEDVVTQLVKNDKFFTGFADLLAKRTPPADGKKKRKAQVALTEQDAAKLEGGFGLGDFSGIIRSLENANGKKNINIFRTSNGPGHWVYHGFNGSYAWWRESLVLNWKEGWMARIRTYVPTLLPPGT